MRNVGIQPEFEPFRIDHDEFNFIRLRLKQDRHHERVHADRFTRTGRTGDQQMRHFGEIGNVFRTVDRLTKSKRQQRSRLGRELRRLDHFAKKNGLAFLIRYLDADVRFARNAVDTDRRSFERETQIIHQTRHPRILHTRVRLKLKRRHHRPGSDVHHLAGHAEFRSFLY